MIQASGPLDITIFGVQSLYQACSRTIKTQGLAASGAFMVKLLNCFHVGYSCKVGTLL